MSSTTRHYATTLSGSRASAAWLGDLLLVAALGSVLASFFPYFPAIRSANELSRVYLAEALVVDRSLSIDGAIARHGDIFDKSVRSGHAYSDKAPGAAFFAAPALAAYRATVSRPSLRAEVRLARLWVSTLPTLFLLWALLRLLAERSEIDAGLRRVLVAGYALGTPAAAYATLLFGHQLSAVLLFGCFLVARRASPAVRPLRALFVGATAAAAIVVEYPNAVFAAAIACWYLWRTRLAWRGVGYALLGAAPLLLLLGAYHHAAFGAPWTTGYAFIASEFRHVHQQGLMGVALPQARHLWLSLFSPSKGLLFFAPFLALALLGIPAAWRDRRDGRITLGMIVLWLLFVSALVYPFGGWSVSQRHLTPLLPWLLLPIGYAVARWGWLRPVLAGLVAASVAICGLSMVVWPHFAEGLRNPFFQVAWPLAKEGWLPPSVWGAWGLETRTVVLATAGLVAIGLALELWRSASSPRRAALRVGLATLIAASYLGLGSRFYRDQDVQRDLRWIRSVYVRDSVRPGG